MPAPRFSARMASLSGTGLCSKLFHVVPYGETTYGRSGLPSDFDTGMLIGLLIGEGHFGGDGKQPQITIRMHTRHEAMFFWLRDKFPGGRLYGPYDHSGRSYYQWMARGSYLRDELVPLLKSWISPERDGYTFERFQQMIERYSAQLGPKLVGD
jgi:hypothetical protein